MVRKSIPAAQLYAVLDREFRALRPARCKHCRVPLPFPQDAPDEVSANWVIGNWSECSHGCHLVIAELLATLWTRYDLKEPTAPSS
jgi:hypothetical protein